MNFRRGVRREDPEINFIPLIDLLLVILIFLMVTTTYNRYSELRVNLPTADGERIIERPTELVVAVTSDGHYRINSQAAASTEPAALANDLRRNAGPADGGTAAPTVVIQADAGATHQSVINVLEAARLAGLAHVSFSSRTTAAN